MDRFADAARRTFHSWPAWKQRAAVKLMEEADSKNSSPVQSEHPILFRGFHQILDIEGEKVRGELVSEHIGDQDIEGYWITGIGIHYPQSPNYMGTCWIEGDMHVANDWIKVIPDTVEIKIGTQPWFPMKYLAGSLPAEILPKFADRPYWHVSLQGSGDGWKIMPSHVAMCPGDYNYGSRWLAYASEPEGGTL